MNEDIVLMHGLKYQYDAADELNALEPCHCGMCRMYVGNSDLKCGIVTYLKNYSLPHDCAIVLPRRNTNILANANSKTPYLRLVVCGEPLYINISRYGRLSELKLQNVRNEQVVW